ncbi:DUF6415 family natural product biosynthesis protein [Streptomyces sp. NBC_01508]|uniref:DUF6415 family natural product biosynthesis protein n=1 Tax=Streptomyces sp. NBC_01508 TaxID=2903888 RepID=UPI0038639507
MTGTLHDITGEAVALHALPPLDTLTDDQARGAVCVWDAAEPPLTAETAVDLGERPSAEGGHWFPHGCRPHAAQHTHAGDPLDIATMREAVQRLLGPAADPPGAELDLLILQLRGHLNLLISELDGCDDPRAEAGLGEARRRLSAGPGSLGPLRHATLLARSVVALCTHAERLAVTG